MTRSRLPVHGRWCRKAYGSVNSVVPILCWMLIGMMVRVAPTQTELEADSVIDQAKRLRAEQHEIATTLLKKFPTDFNSIRVMGFAHSSHGNREKMFLCWKRCQQLKPDRPDVYDQLGRYYAHAERFDEAIAAWNRTRQLDPKFPGVWLRMGQTLFDAGKVDQAARAIKQQIKLTPQNAQAHYLLGESYFQQQDFQNAKACFAAAFKFEPFHSNACYGLIKTSARLSLTDEMRIHSQEFARLETATIKADIEKRKRFDDLTEMKKRLAITCVDAGRVYLMQATPDQAKRLWIRAIQVEPTNIAGRQELAKLSKQQGDLQRAATHYADLTRIQPNQLSHYLQAGRLQTQLKNLPAAESMFQGMVHQQPSNAVGYRVLARFYLDTQQKKKKALELANRAIALDPSAESHFLFGWSSAMNGKVATAQAALKKAIELDPNNATYRKVLAVVEQNKR